MHVQAKYVSMKFICIICTSHFVDDCQSTFKLQPELLARACVLFVGRSSSSRCCSHCHGHRPQFFQNWPSKRYVYEPNCIVDRPVVVFKFMLSLLGVSKRTFDIGQRNEQASIWHLGRCYVSQGMLYSSKRYGIQHVLQNMIYTYV